MSKTPILKKNEGYFYYKELLKQLGILNEVHEQISKKYGVVQVVKFGKGSLEYKLNDFYHFCFVKACKSLNATETLAMNFMQEDSQTILRTAYECYLNASFARNNPNSLDELIDYKIGLSDGVFKHPISKNGKVQRDKIIHPKTGEIIRFGITISHMANNNSILEDGPLFAPLYKHLSEHVHVHFMTSGNYRNKDELRYTMYNFSMLLQPVYHAVLVSLMMITDSLFFIQDMDIKLLNKVKKIISESNKMMLAITKNSTDSDESKSVILNRLVKIENTINNKN